MLIKPLKNCNTVQKSPYPSGMFSSGFSGGCAGFPGYKYTPAKHWCKSEQVFMIWESGMSTTITEVGSMVATRWILALLCSVSITGTFCFGCS